MKCECGSNMSLVFYTSRESKNYRFFWGCEQYPNCRNTKDYISEGIQLSIAERETMDAIQIIKNGSVEEKASMINEVRVQMVEILNHFIECTWGAHYMTLLNEIIIPYLDNPTVLKYVLKGPVISENKGNVFFGASGSKMFNELLYCLKRVKSPEIQKFLNTEFKQAEV